MVKIINTGKELVYVKQGKTLVAVVRSGEEMHFVPAGPIDIIGTNYECENVTDSDERGMVKGDEP